MIKIVHNKLLRGWYVVRGPHHFPLAGPFANRADAKAWLNRPRPFPAKGATEFPRIRKD